MSDSGKIPVPPSPHPCSSEWMRNSAWFIGETARPFAIFVTASATGAAIVILAYKVSGPEAAVFLGAAFLGLGTLYGVKGVEGIFKTKADAEVQKEVAKQGGV